MSDHGREMDDIHHSQRRRSGQGFNDDRHSGKYHFLLTTQMKTYEDDTRNKRNCGKQSQRRVNMDWKVGTLL
ncbi:MAG: hypothetical protein R3B95_13030 [Nitrospirales bacterium]|nr:hypothetical protein [Nitrospirales bacterium]